MWMQTGKRTVAKIEDYSSVTVTLSSPMKKKVSEWPLATVFVSTMMLCYRISNKRNNFAA